MTAVSTDLLLDATEVEKRYGAVVALRSASLAVRPGEVHALMGANGAGKSTLVKILTGAVQPDGGTITVRGRPYAAHSPAEARSGGIVSVYQEPALIPDLDIRSNLRLTADPDRPVRHWLEELGLPDLDLGDMARRPATRLAADHRPRPRPGHRARRADARRDDRRAARQPHRAGPRGHRPPEGHGPLRDLHLPPADRDRGRLRPGDRPSRGRHRRRRRRERGRRGADRRADARRHRQATSRRSGRAAPRSRRRGRPTRAPHRRAASLPAGTKLSDVSFDLFPGEVLGVVALEGQGQDELFDILAGSRAAGRRRAPRRRAPVAFRHPADAIRAGLVYVPADRAEALLMQRSVRENIALPFTARLRAWGLIDVGGERKRVDEAIATLQIDTRAASEVRRLSGGNQQKVTIARWVAGGVRTMLCFDPTRGIDIGTKQQIYQLLRDLAAAGAAVLLYTSELKEIQLACDRAIVIFGGRVVAEIAAAEADEPTLLRAAYDLQPDAPMPEESPRRSRPSAAADAAVDGRARPAPPTIPSGRDARVTAAPERSAATRSEPGRRGADSAAKLAGPSASSALLIAFLAITKLIQPNYGAPGIQGLAISLLPIAFAAVAQAIVVISGGIDLSVGSMMALTSVTSAVLMKGQGDAVARRRRPWRAADRDRSGRHQRRADRRVAGPGHRRDAGDVVRLGRLALLILDTPGGGAAQWLMALISGRSAANGCRGRWSSRSSWSAVVWIPLRRSTLGLSLYAIGSNQLAAFRSGVPVGRTKIVSYALTGFFAALGGLH